MSSKWHRKLSRRKHSYLGKNHRYNYWSKHIIHYLDKGGLHSDCSLYSLKWFHLNMFNSFNHNFNISLTIGYNTILRDIFGTYGGLKCNIENFDYILSNLNSFLHCKWHSLGHSSSILIDSNLNSTHLYNDSGIAWLLDYSMASYCSDYNLYNLS